MANQLTAIKKDVFDAVESSVNGYIQDGSLSLPAGYAVGNALKSAWLKLLETVDANKRPVLEACSKPSIISSLQAMVYQGLNPAKNQCYFIAYGDKLTLQRSYFGAMHVAKVVDPGITDITFDVVYEGDVFEMKKQRGRTVIAEHTPKLSNMDKSKIIAAYCSIFRGDIETTTVMTFEDIKQSWSQSKAKPIDENGNLKPNSTHAKFTREMAIKTVVNRACKYVINSSDDNTLLSGAYNGTYDDTQEREDIIDAEIEQSAFKEEINIDEYTESASNFSNPQREAEATPADVDF